LLGSDFVGSKADGRDMEFIQSHDVVQ
jgi:hypothetical protein